MAVTTTYVYPVAGTVCPTSTQAGQTNAVIAQIAFGDTDTSGLITHNFGLTQASQLQPYVPNTLSGTPPTYTGATGIATVWPIVLVRYDPSTAGTIFCTLIVTLTNSVAVTVAKPSTVGSNGVWLVTLLRPWSGAV